MKVMTVKLNPKTVFGLILVAAGVLVVLRQGIYHQVKRMFARVGCTVTALHRTAMGALELDPTLAPGDCRALTPAEVALLAKDTVQ